jgi:hypothetical protein
VVDWVTLLPFFYTYVQSRSEVVHPAVAEKRRQKQRRPLFLFSSSHLLLGVWGLVCWTVLRETYYDSEPATFFRATRRILNTVITENVTEGVCITVFSSKCTVRLVRMEKVHACHASFSVNTPLARGGCSQVSGAPAFEFFRMTTMCPDYHSKPIAASAFFQQRLVAFVCVCDLPAVWRTIYIP